MSVVAILVNLSAFGILFLIDLPSFGLFLKEVKVLVEELYLFNPPPKVPTQIVLSLSLNIQETLLLLR